MGKRAKAKNKWNERKIKSVWIDASNLTDYLEWLVDNLWVEDVDILLRLRRIADPSSMA